MHAADSQTHPYLGAWCALPRRFVGELRADDLRWVRERSNDS
jgi:hypothetical protein